MNDLDKALEWAEQWEGTDTNGAKRILTLAAAVRELRETVKAKDEEIARLQHIVDEKPLTFLRGLEDEAIEKLIQQNDELRSAIRKAAGDLSFLDQALNENDGVYKP